MGGRRIDDHKFWAGGRGNNSVLPDGPYKTQTHPSAEGSGAVNYYEDTTETIKDQQNMSVRKVEGHKQKVLHRN